MIDLKDRATDELIARRDEIIAETAEGTETRAQMDAETINARADELEAITAELNARAEAAEAERREAAENAGKPGRKIIEEERKMNYEINSPEYRSAFLRNLQGQELNAEERAAVSAASVIPQITADKIYGKMELYPLFNAVDVMHIPGTVVLPVEGVVNDANVVAMGAAATDSADTITSVSLGAYKLIKTVEITADVAAMAIDAFEDWLVERLANKMYRLITKLIAKGTGTSEPTGLTAVDATGNTYTKAAITYADILAIISKLPTEYTPGAVFVMSRTTFYQNVLALVDTAKRPIVVQDVQSPAKFNILGYQVILEDEMGTDIVFGDLKEGYAFNFGREISIDRDESVGFRTGSSVFRAMCLADGKPTGVGIVRYTKAV